MSSNLAVSTINGVDISVSPVATESKVIGVGQTWQDVTVSRVLGTTYTNSTGKPIMVSIAYIGALSFIISGLTVTVAGSTDGSQTKDASFVIPKGATYSSSNATKWFELR